MKKLILLAFAIIAGGLFFAFMPKDDRSSNPTYGDETIKWYSFEEAVKANKSTKKKIFIDVYTDWCGWCKRMDATTFSDPDVAKYVNANFYPVKLNAEQKEDIVFNGKTFKWVASGRGGVNMLANSLLDGNLGFPSYVYLTPEYERILISPGYKPVPDFTKELRFVSEGHYANTTWEQYRKNH